MKERKREEGINIIIKKEGEKEQKGGRRKESCRRRRNGKHRWMMSLLIILFLASGIRFPVEAATETGNIEICLEDNEKKMEKEGIMLRYSRVASLVDGVYEMEKKYQDKGIDLNKVQYARELEETARELSEYRFSDGICRTDREGKAVLTNLRAGVYLIYAVDQTECEIQPILAQLPKWEEEEHVMEWEVKVYPKQTARVEAAKTGDFEQTAGWAFVCFGAGVLILLIALKKE